MQSLLSFGGLRSWSYTCVAWTSYEKEKMGNLFLSLGVAALLGGLIYGDVFIQSVFIQP